MRYLDLVSEFEADGSLRDIYALDTSVTDWNRLLNLSPSLGEAAYFRGGKAAPLPTSASSIFEDVDHSHLLQFSLGGPVINTHFFIADEIEFDLDPKEITSQVDLDLVLDFCASVGRGIQRDIRITPENDPDIFYLRYSVKQQSWQRRKSP